MSEQVNLPNSLRKTTRHKIERLMETQHLSPCGAKWLFTALDPFHDQEMACDGYPDIQSSRSVVQVVTYTQQITSYQTTPTLTWDCHIPFTPVTYDYTLNSLEADYFGPSPLWRTIVEGNTFGSQDGAGGAPTYPQLFPGYCAVSVPAGTDLTAATGSRTWSDCAFHGDFAGGNRRLIAAGYEVVNVTAELYKQGTVTAYRTPSSLTNSFALDSASSLLPVMKATLGPTNQAAAQLYPSARTWGAIDGIYSVATLNTMQNNFTSSFSGYAGIEQMDSASSNQNTYGWYPNVNVEGSISLVESAESFNRQLPYDVHGCIFSGLSPQTVLQLTTRYYYELVPDTTDPVMVVMAKPSPCLDELALRLYSRALEHLPIAVPVDQNPLGEWFETVMDVIANGLPVIGTALATVFPPAAVIGTAASIAAQSIKYWNRQERIAEMQAQTVARPITSSTITTKRAAMTRRLPKPKTKRPVGINKNRRRR